MANIKKVFIHGFGSKSCISEFDCLINKEGIVFNWKPLSSLDKLVDGFAEIAKDCNVIVSTSFGSVIASIACSKYSLKVSHKTYCPFFTKEQIQNVFFDNLDFPVDLVTKERLKSNDKYFIFNESWNNLKVCPSFYISLLSIKNFKPYYEEAFVGEKDKIIDCTNINLDKYCKNFHLFATAGHDVLDFI
jgi:hypothetical protein